MGLWAGGPATGKLYKLYSFLCLETVIPALKLTQNCYFHHNTTFSLEN